jgi:hypothetical protein
MADQICSGCTAGRLPGDWRSGSFLRAWLLAPGLHLFPTIKRTQVDVTLLVASFPVLTPIMECS